LVGRRRALHIERDAKHPQMWRVRLPDGTGGDLTATGPECLATLARKYLALGHSPDQELDVGRRYGRWTARDLFGLQTPPAKPHPSYSRLSRYDETGLIWLLQGRLVVALTETTAAIQNPTGAITTYRRHNKPALGPPGDSLDDPNDDKERDYSGTLDVGGEEFWVSGWVKTSKAGRKYLSIAVKKKVEKPAKSEKSLAEDCNQIPF
jgi:hypothetical protein